jgi:hypothetical protein
LLVVEPGAYGRAVEVLQRAATRLGAHELHESGVQQDPHVVADVAQRFAERSGEVGRAGHAVFREALQDPLAHGVRERFGELRIYVDDEALASMPVRNIS